MRSVVESYRGSSVRVFRLERDACIARLRDRARALLEREPEVREIVLFGSLARGDATPGSDADLLVVVSDSVVRPLVERAAWLLPHLSGVGIGCDLFVYTESERERLRRAGSRILRAAETEGILLGVR